MVMQKEEELELEFENRMIKDHSVRIDSKTDIEDLSKTLY